MALLGSDHIITNAPAAITTQYKLSCLHLAVWNKRVGCVRALLIAMPGCVQPLQHSASLIGSIEAELLGEGIAPWRHIVPRNAITSHGDTAVDLAVRACVYARACATGYLSFGTIEKILCFCDLSVHEKDWRAASQAFERMHNTLRAA